MEKTLTEPGVKAPVITVVACDKCENTWLEPVQVNRFLSKEVPIGNAPETTIAGTNFIVLRCVLCGHTMVPMTDSFVTQGAYFSRFAEMANTVEDANKEKPSADEDAE